MSDDKAKRSALIMIDKALDSERPESMGLYTPALASALIEEGEDFGPCPDNPNTMLITGARNGFAWWVRLAGWTP